ncbi:MAG: DivIVA domain-containing protein [Erysipelotrichaceae bacterium]|nr:DivIVA domain-containing protein [Erysipelotrichaceae bacterium]
MNNHQFKKQLFGYNKREVDQTIENLQLLIDNKDLEISKLSKEKSSLTEQNALLSHRVNINEKTNEEIARLALKEASELIEKAKRNANMILKESLDYVRDLNNEVEGYKDQAIAFRASVEKMSKDLIDTIDQSEVFYLINESKEEK